MKDEDKTRDQLMAELQESRRRINQFKQAEITWKNAEKALRLSEENRKESEKKLTRSLAELNAIINALPGLVSVVDTDFNVLVANDEVYKKFGQKGIQEIIGQKCHMTRKGLVDPCPHCNLVGTFKTGKPVSRLSTPEEEELMGIATKAYAIPLKDENGVIWGGVEVIMDITDIRRTQKNLRKSEEQVQLALRSADLGIWDWDLSSGDITYNERMTEMLGYTLDEIGPNSNFWPHLYHPDDLPGINKKLNAHLEGETAIFESEQRLLAKEGTWKWVLSIGKVLERDEKGKPIRMTGIHLDITERKFAEQAIRESEEKYRALINGMHDTVWVLGFDGKIIDTNQAAIEILGYTRKELSRMHIAAIDPNIGDGTLKMINKEKLSNKIKIFETIHTTKNGKQIPVEIQCSGFKYQRKDAILSIARDITKRKRAEEELLRLRKLDSVGVLAGGIAHDFNNLLTAIFGNIEMGKMLLPSHHKAYEFLDQAGQSLEIATKLTKQLLTFAKGGDPIKETLSIGEAITEAAQFSLRGSNAILETDIIPDLWPIEADKGQLSHAISNIIINARQAMSDGGTIKLGAENIERLNKKYIKIVIADKGVGIAPRHLDRIFDPYFTTKQKGSGLGLATTHSIITKHGGTISVDSIVNQGTKFTIQLPAAKISQETLSAASLDLNRQASIFLRHILVVDDEKTIRDLLGAMLQRMGHKVAFAVNGQEAIVKYRKAYRNGTGYDIVIMDLTIPGGMGGEKAAHEILKLDPMAKLIVSSGYTTDPVMANYQDYGFQGIMAKPYRFAELKKVITQVVKN
jgi:two-component system cell cycle sensor histidine kinase/response regulator CckA